MWYLRDALTDAASRAGRQRIFSVSRDAHSPTSTTKSTLGAGGTLVCDALETGFEAESGARRPKLFFLVRRVDPGVRQRTRDRGSMAYMVSTFEPSAAVVILAVMVTPALRLVGGVTP
ncbi:MAG TPA: hypothetical protein VF764_04070 [Steroidobacteraceae bacterium]